MKYQLEELIDVKRLEEVLNHLYVVTGIPSGIINAEGKTITAAGWQTVCTKFHRVNPITKARCERSSANMKNKIASGEAFVLSRCRNGMADIMSPIKVNNQYIATIFQGQFFIEEPDLDYFRQQAKEVGFDEESYIAEILKTPIVSEETVYHIAHFLSGLAKFIADIGYSKAETAEAYRELSKSHEEISSLYEELLATEEDLREHYDLLNQRKEELEISERRYELVAEGSNDVIWDINLKTKDIFCSSRIKELLGYTREEINSREAFLKLIHPEDAARVSGSFDASIADGSDYSNQYRCIRADKETIWISTKAKVLKNNNGKAIRVAGSFRDITEEIEHQLDIERMAYTDSLTSIHNRNHCLKTLNTMLNSNNNTTPDLSVFFLDLDNFKNINDIYGHQVGDAVLVSVAKRLSEITQNNMSLSRFGGDEFVIISDTHDKKDLEAYAKAMLHALEAPFTISDKSFYISASIGIACYPSGGTTAESLLKNADMSMYAAKKNGKSNYAYFEQEMHETNKRKRDIEESLNAAIENDELFVTYQPKVDIKTNAIKGVEALIRWKDPNHGIISPIEFIPIAEERGIIKKIDKWVIDHVLAQKKHWDENGFDFGTISINISPNFLMAQDTLPYLDQLIKTSKIDTQRLQFELTENVLITSFSKATEKITALKQLGFSIALDDFGKGYSSLSYLKKLPIDTLKIDKIFIDELLDEEHPIVDLIVNMGQRLNMTVIAEGVETESQLESLRHCGCDLYQGYYYSRPLTADLLEASSI